MVNKTKVKVVVLDAYLGDREYVFDVPTGKECKHSPLKGLSGGCDDCGKYVLAKRAEPAPIEEEAKECDHVISGDWKYVKDCKTPCTFCGELITLPGYIMAYKPSTTPQDIAPLPIPAHWNPYYPTLLQQTMEKVNQLLTAWNALIKEGK